MYREQAYIIIQSITVSIYKRSSHLANIFLRLLTSVKYLAKLNLILANKQGIINAPPVSINV